MNSPNSPIRGGGTCAERLRNGWRHRSGRASGAEKLERRHRLCATEDLDRGTVRAVQWTTRAPATGATGRAAAAGGVERFERDRGAVVDDDFVDRSSSAALSRRAGHRPHRESEGEPEFLERYPAFGRAEHPPLTGDRLRDYGQAGQAG
jgi:hypothetical protein